VRALGLSGSGLAVGQDASQLDEVQALVSSAFGWSLAATLVMAILSGMVMSGSILRRIRSVTRTTNAIMQGDLSQRLQHRGVSDEFDQLAEAVNAMLVRIEVLVNGLKQVSNDIAHDLRTPLSRLRQRFEMARSAKGTLCAYEALIDRSIVEMDAILEAFSAMLRIADIEATTRRSGFAPVDLSELLRTMVEVYEPSAAERSQRVESEISPNVMVRGDRELLNQLFANLVENAIKHTPTGSRVSVEARRIAGVVEVAIADTGPGIPEAERKNVFRRFYRLESSRSTPGSGLGLSLVAAVAALHGADIALTDNHPGLRVLLSLPADSAR
jgi:signal transduction histidine kinase